MRRARKNDQDDVLPSVLARLTALEEAVQENRRLNQRLADVVDVVTEVLVPAVDRDDERMQAALARLTQVLDEDAPTDLSEPHDGISSQGSDKSVQQGVSGPCSPGAGAGR